MIEKLIRKCRDCSKEFQAERETFTQNANAPSTMVDPITGRGFKSLVSSVHGKFVATIKGRVWLCNDCFELYSLHLQLKELEKKQKKIKFLKSRGYDNEQIKQELQGGNEDEAYN